MMHVLNAIGDEIIASTTKKNLAKLIKYSLTSKEFSAANNFLRDNPDRLMFLVKAARSEIVKPKRIFNDISMLDLMLSYQAQFYALSKCFEDNIAAYYFEISSNYERIYRNICSVERAAKCISIPFEFDLNADLPIVLKSAEEFRDALIPSLKAIFSSQRDIIIEGVKSPYDELGGLFPFYAYMNDVAANPKPWIKKIRKWYYCFKAHKLHYIDNLTKTNMISEFRFGEIEPSNALHKIDEYLNDAAALIASAERGIFPYLIPVPDPQ